jgi:hypothetical protein
MTVSGAGMLIGYRFGHLGRPMGYGHSRYGYDYIHKDRDYDMSTPYKCSVANVTEYLKTMAEAQEINADEGEIKCPNADDICFGRLQITTVSKADDEDTVLGLEVRLEKGCGSRARFESEETDSAYNATRKCWVGRQKKEKRSKEIAQ